jgi:hypothetical protein
MDVNTDALIPGLLCLAYLASALFVKGGFWRQNLVGKGGRWVSYQEEPIFFILMIILFAGLGIILTIQGLNII